MLVNLNKDKSKKRILVCDDMHPQNLNVIKTRVYYTDSIVEYLPYNELINSVKDDVIGVIVQNPNT